MVGRSRRSVKFGRYMRDLREKRLPGVTPEGVAQQAACRRETVTTLENGSKRGSTVLVGSLLNIYRASDDERAEAFRLWEYAGRPTRVIEHAADLPPGYLAFRRDESEATSERTIDHICIPGPLQTAGYAAALARAGQRLSRAVGWEERAAEERQSRQRLLDGSSPLRLHSLIAEAALYTQVGGQDTMHEQLEHLIVRNHDNVVVQVVPSAQGAWGTMTGSAIILGFGEPDEPDVVYVESPAGGGTIDKEDDVAAFKDLFEDAARLAFPVAASNECITKAMKAVRGR